MKKALANTRVSVKLRKLQNTIRNILRYNLL